MDNNVIHQPNNTPPLLLYSNGNNNMKEPNTILSNKCSNCQDNNSRVSCNHCTSIKDSNICTNADTAVLSKTSSILEHKTDKQSSGFKVPKRGYKSHVPSACVNCKTAHLACDVSRPCKRCISLKKEDTCQDMQHKKRGRPKLREKRVYSSNEHTYEILYGTIQEPAIMTKNTPRNIIPNQQAPPFHAKTLRSQHKVTIPSITNDTKRSSIISFVHESFEPPYEPPTQSTRATSSPISEINSLTSSNNTYLTIETVAALPTVQLSSIPLTSQPLLFNYSNSTPSSFTPIANTSHSSPAAPQQESPSSLTIILSMEVCCAKVSDDTIKCWGYYPQELAHRSFYDFISPKDTDRLARLHRLLIDNAMNVTNSHQTGEAAPLPPTERTTSLLFSNTAHSQLNAIANGSRSFSDTIHIKKSTGEYELYKVVVYIGGGLGADLYDASTLSKQYIVAQFKRHEYEVIVPPPQAAASNVAPQKGITSIPTFRDETPISADDLVPYYNSIIQPIAAFSPMSPLTPTSPTNSSSLNFGSNNAFPTTSTIHRNSGSNLDAFNRNSVFNHQPSISKPNPSFAMTLPSASPKFNIAPTTNTTNSLFSRFQPTSSSPQPPSSAAPVHMQSSSMTVTHPTQQYFLQTSSSTLNAAASAVQNKSRSSIPSKETTVAPPDRKIEMSIRSLLC